MSWRKQTPWVSLGQQAEYMEQWETPCSGRGGPWEISPEDTDLPMRRRSTNEAAWWLHLPCHWLCFVKTNAFYLWQIFWEDKLQLLSNPSQEEIKDLPKIFHRQTAHPLYAGSLTGCELQFTFGIEYIFNFHCFTIYTRCKYCSDLVMKPAQWSRRLMLTRKEEEDCGRHLRSSLALNMQN